MSLDSMIHAAIVMASMMIYTAVSAYVFKFGKPRTGIFFDYGLLTFFFIIAFKLGGAI